MSNSDPYLWNQMPCVGVGNFPGQPPLPGSIVSTYNTLQRDQLLQAQMLAAQANAIPNPIPQASYGYSVSQYRSKVEQLLPLDPKHGDIVTLFFNGHRWQKLVYAKPEPDNTAEAASSFSLDELAEAADMIDEIEHGRAA